MRESGVSLSFDLPFNAIDRVAGFVAPLTVFVLKCRHELDALLMLHFTQKAECQTPSSRRGKK